ncbi:MAG TPA: type III-B CRISPR module RAMP protein Cmr6 [Agitococcus sp.]|nr:type III-B CRISPR module RAMP protein Cmr6 [Agitococcus sp.]
MTQLIRKSLQDLISHSTSAHAGLLLTRGLTTHEGSQNEKEDTNNQKKCKERLVTRTTNTVPSKLYQHAFARWQGLTSQKDNFGHLTATLSGRLMMGLSTGGAVETGVSTHHTYGMPMIAGSSVKGVTRTYAESIKLDPKYIAVLFGVDESLATRSGQLEGAGCLVWHDAWWIPNGTQKPFVEEIVTVHHQDYYAGTKPATDFDSPTPNQQIAVQGSFYFVIEGDANWLTLALKLLSDALAQQGIGAKRAAGYGFMPKSDFVAQQKRKEQAKKDQEAAILKEKMASMTENQQLLKAFEIKLSATETWKNGSVSSDLMGFNNLYKVVEQWTETDDIKAAIVLFEGQVKEWLKQPIRDNKNWRDKIKKLKSNAGLLP